MAKSYDLGKKSDMKRFARNLEREIRGIAEKKIEQVGLEIECPGCGTPMSVTPGLNTCPSCGETRGIAFDWTGL